MNQVTAKFITDDSITFKYAKGASSETGKEFHSFHEIIYFMGGEANFISESIQTTLKPNTLIVIPCETYHQLQITGSQNDYHRCVFHFLEIPNLKDLINHSTHCTMLIEMTPALHFLFQQMIALTEHQNENTNNPQLMHAILTLLLNEISTHGNNKLENTIPTTISEKCMAYIADHIHLPISVDDIAKELNISVSHLAHSFKKQMNISIHQYILKKKLATAHHKIMDGKPATQAAMECGFNDYSGFYKQFKKIYHVAPSDCVFRMK